MIRGQNSFRQGLSMGSDGSLLVRVLPARLCIFCIGALTMAYMSRDQKPIALWTGGFDMESSPVSARVLQQRKLLKLT